MSHDPAVEAVVDRVAALLNDRIGLRPEPTLRARLHRCVRDEAAAHGQDLQAYLGTLTAGADALQSLLNRVTVQETAFFRHPDHFEVLARHILPRLREPVTIWSAGCANGQEAYTIAMLLDELGIEGTVVATDLSTAALQRTAAARYATRELRGLSPVRQQRHLTPSGKGWLVNDSVRRRVTTLRHNLVDPPPDPVRACQVVFCRNVLIYFSVEHAQAFLDRAADVLPTGGCLFLGAAETMRLPGVPFETVRIDDTYLYRRVAAAPPAPVAEPVPVAPRHSTRTRRRPEPGDEIRAARRRARRSGTEAVRHAEPSAALVHASAGKCALDAGDFQQAVVAFRKWAYVAPDDALAHLHLGLALEAAGDDASAQRAFRAARLAAQNGDQACVEHAMEGYAPGELLRLLDAKQGEVRQ